MLLFGVINLILSFAFWIYLKIKSTKMKISNDKKLKDLQCEFNQNYPFLKIEFFKKSHDFGDSSDEKKRLDPEMTVGEIRQLPTYGYMPLNGYQKINTFEQLFARAFGLHVQVFRKSCNKWLQTWASDMWTLDEQNTRGRIMSQA